jgi:hypothetical protein
MDGGERRIRLGDGSETTIHVAPQQTRSSPAALVLERLS